MSNSSYRILFTREIGPAYIQQALAQDIEIDVIPFIKTTTCFNDVNGCELEELAIEHVTAVFTSASAVNAIAYHAINATWNVYCLAGATQDMVKKKLPYTTIKATAANAAELANTIVKNNEVKRVHFFCGDLHLPKLPQILANNNIDVVKYIVYKTQLSPVSISKHYDGIAFYSPSAVESFLSKNTLPEDAFAFCIGSTTARALKNYTDKIVVSEVADTAHLLQTVIAHFKTEKN